MLGYLFADTICSEKQTVFRKFSRFSWGVFSHVVRLDQSRASENIKYKSQSLIMAPGCPKEAGRYQDGLHNED